ncbi:hypothetical protein J2T02_000122 [Chitinophaga terrae (ex Kim and Jung 2007)]|nr:hypothetical protein [Chitinophaga terrae (ex Kim and Jung 2007)]
MFHINKFYTIGFLIILLLSCSTTKRLKDIVDKQVYKSDGGHVYRKGQIVLGPNNNFTFLGIGPAIIFSTGEWYIKSKKIIILKSYPGDKYSLSDGFHRVDTVYLSFSNDTVYFINKKHLVFRNIDYYLEK